jgi:hypothetical protein
VQLLAALFYWHRCGLLIGELGGFLVALFGMPLWVSPRISLSSSPPTGKRRNFWPTASGLIQPESFEA